MYRNVPAIAVFVFGILATSGLFGQEAILSSGHDAVGSGGSVAYSVGQVAYAHFSSDEGAISLGAQQPNLIIIVGVDDPEQTIAVAMNPNPVKSTGILHLSDAAGNANFSACAFELYDISGRLLLRQAMVDPTTIVSMEQFENAMYLVKVRCQGAEIKTFKVIKTN